MHFSAVVALVAQLLGGERRGQVATQDHPVQEVLLLAVIDRQLHVAGLEARGHIPALPAQLFGHRFHRWLHRVVHEAVDLVAHREVHGLAQALAPALVMAVVADQRRGPVLQRALAVRFVTEGAGQPPHHQQQDRRERQRGQHHRRFQRIDAPSQQQPGGQHRDHRAPEHAKPTRTIILRCTAMRGQRGQHHRPRVGRGHKENEADQHRHRDHRAAPRVAIQQCIQHRRWIIHRQLCQLLLAVVQDLVQRAVAEDRQPGQGEAQRDQQHAEHEFADGAAT